MAVDLNIIRKSGAWFTYDGEQLGQGRENAKTFLTDNPEIMVDISDKVLTLSGLKPSDETIDGRSPQSMMPTAAVGGFSEADEEPINLDR
ncbi:MAG: hypothetical protein WKF58_11475 [Ilumatobacteraceae bacterium]